MIGLQIRPFLRSFFITKICLTESDYACSIKEKDYSCRLEGGTGYGLQNFRQRMEGDGNSLGEGRSHAKRGDGCPDGGVEQKHGVYLSEHKGLVAAEGSPKRYAAVIGREECVRQEEESFLNKVYHGSAGKLVAAFVEEGRLTEKEKAMLKQLLEGMDV